MFVQTVQKTQINQPPDKLLFLQTFLLKFFNNYIKT